MDFKKVEIVDKKSIDEVLKTYPCHSLEYNFTTLFIWQKIFKTEFLIRNGFLHAMSGKTKKSFLFPAGDGDIKKELDFLIDYSKSERMQLCFHSVSFKQKEILETLFPDRFEFFEDRDSGDYVYSAESLKSLTGKKLAAKRNHINRFLENHPEWEYVPIDEKNRDEAIAMHSRWCENSKCDENESLADETCAVKRAFRYYDELGLSGGMLRIQDGICAFSMGDRLNDKTFLVHIEKAFADVQGAYPMINKQFVINACDGYEFVNREDDTGDEGLRRAKLSYGPVEIIKKYVVKER